MLPAARDTGTLARMSRRWICASMLFASMFFASMFFALGCAPSGDDPRSRLDVAGPESGEYRVRYLDPPWQLVRVEGTTTFLRILSNRNTFGGIEGGPGKYDLVVTVEPGTADARVAEEVSRAIARGERAIAGPRAITTDEGVTGQEVLTIGSSREERYFRYVYFPLDASRVVRIEFSATPELDTAEVDAMVRAVGVGRE